MAPRHPHPRILGVLVVMLLACFPQAALADSEFTFTGHGWGHGIGMGQYGAQGYALNGWTHDRILAHYYSGTTLGQAPSQDVRVLLQDGRQQVVVSSDTGLVVSDEGSAAQRQLPGPVRVTVTRDATGFTLLDEAGTPLLSGWVGPVSLAAVSGPVTLVGSAIGGTVNRSYRGRLRVFVNQAGALATYNDALKTRPNSAPVHVAIGLAGLLCAASAVHADGEHRPGATADSRHAVAGPAVDGRCAQRSFALSVCAGLPVAATG